MNIQINRLAPSNKSDFYKVNCKENGTEWCNCVAWWCSTWDEFKTRTKEQNRSQREELFSAGEYDGYVLYVDDQPAGWSQVGKRDRLEKLCKQYNLPPSPNTFAITCFNIAPKFRGKGLVHVFLSSIIEELRSDGVEHIQGFPKPKTDDPWTGPESAFVKAGFTVEVEGEFPVYGLRLK